MGCGVETIIRGDRGGAKCVGLVIMGDGDDDVISRGGESSGGNISMRVCDKASFCEIVDLFGIISSFILSTSVGGGTFSESTAFAASRHTGQNHSPLGI